MVVPGPEVVRRDPDEERLFDLDELEGDDMMPSFDEEFTDETDR